MDPNRARRAEMYSRIKLLGIPGPEPSSPVPIEFSPMIVAGTRHRADGTTMLIPPQPYHGDENMLYRVPGDDRLLWRGVDARAEAPPLLLQEFHRYQVSRNKK